MSTSKRLKADRAAQRRADREAKRARRRDGGLLDRPVDLREERLRVLIVCEGAQTEPNYFQQFPVRATVHVKVEGLGDHTLSLVNRAIERRDAGRYDEAWVVFDRDSFPPDRFRAAIQSAQAAGLRLAYTNEAFECWYLLHFHYTDAALSRATYEARLTEALGRPYRKNDRGMYATLRTRQADAIRNAERLLASYGADHDPERDNPSTTVHRLVQRLTALAKA